MSFKLTTPETVTGDVSITRPGEANPGVIKVTFVYQTARQHDAWRANVLAASSEGKASMTALLSPVIRSIDGFTDADDKPVAYTEAALDTLLDICPASSGELFRGFTTVLTESRAKN